MYFVVFALLLALAFRWPREFWFAGAIAYLVSGPMARLWSIAFPSRNLPPAPPVTAPTVTDALLDPPPSIPDGPI
jgi:hypothetical protein